MQTSAAGAVAPQWRYSLYLSSYESSIDYLCNKKVGINLGMMYHKKVGSSNVGDLIISHLCVMSFYRLCI